ncbi:ADP-ribosylation/Crystallin J1 [Baffinella frigidus]|nr:ADP-ribosylation/Crystallin J1 [Cryptophyta sp. CCMP2293]
MSLPPSARTESSVDADTVDADAWRDRATGAIVGAFIGDAMAMGCHWVYDHSKFVDLYGERVDTYLKPRADGFHADLEAGQYSQTSEICVLLLESLVEKGELDQEDFNSRFDKMLGSCDGQRGGSGRYTPRDICDVYRGRIIEKKEWGKVACGGTDSGDTLGRAALIGVRYAADMPKVAALAKEHVALQVSCPAVQCHAIAVALLTALFVRGEPFDSTVGP